MTSVDPAAFVSSMLTGEDDDGIDPDPPAWTGPPHDVEPGSVPIAVNLGESETAAVLLTTVKAYPTGVSLIVSTHFKTPWSSKGIADPIGEGRVRLSIELPDGQTLGGTDPLPEYEHPNAQRLRPCFPEDADWAPSHPVLRRGGGAGSESVFEQEYWLWPLPSQGTVAITCEWPDQGIPAHTHQFEGQLFREAAAQARPVRRSQDVAPPWPTPHRQGRSLQTPPALTRIDADVSNHQAVRLKTTVYRDAALRSGQQTQGNQCGDVRIRGWAFAARVLPIVVGPKQ